MDLRPFIAKVPDFPIPGILFRDITPLLADADAMGEVVDRMSTVCRESRVELVAGIESRGFLFGVPVALELGIPFVPLRKPGKLPRRTLERSYALEYGEATLQVHADDIPPGARVAIVDDLLATGGTAKAAAELVEEAGGEVVQMLFLIELLGLGGRDLIPGRPAHALLPLAVDGAGED